MAGEIPHRDPSSWIASNLPSTSTRNDSSNQALVPKKLPLSRGRVTGARRGQCRGVPCSCASALGAAAQPTEGRREQEAMLIKPTSGGEVQVAGQRQADGAPQGMHAKSQIGRCRSPCRGRLLLPVAVEGGLAGGRERPRDAGGPVCPSARCGACSVGQAIIHASIRQAIHPFIHAVTILQQHDSRAEHEHSTYKEQEQARHVAGAMGHRIAPHQ